MYDYFKAWIFELSVDELLNSPELDFKIEVSTQSGELGTTQKAKYKHLTFTIKNEKYISLSGSLHKFYNALCGIYAPNQKTDEQREKGFNGNQFSITQVRYSLYYLQSKFHFQLENAVIRNIEFGLNLELFCSFRSIAPYLLRHEGQSLRNPFEGFYKFDLGQYEIKCYNKASQYGMAGKIMRLELKFKKMEKLKFRGSLTLHHLTERTRSEAFKRILLNEWNRILFFDRTIRKNALKPSEQRKLELYSNPNYWNQKLAPNRHDYHKNRLKELTLNYSDHVQDKISELIEKQFTQLNASCETQQNST
jgi:hypothetical protein